MTWSYDETVTAAKDKVRVLVGDIDATDKLVEDEFITFALDQAGDNIYEAAALAATAIASRFARETDTSVESLRVSASQKYEQYKSLAFEMKRKASEFGTGSATPVVGGVSIAEKDSVEEDTDRVKPKFKTDLHKNPSGLVNEEECAC